jgi:hypothetical protein
VIDGRTSVVGRSHRPGTIERVVSERTRRATSVVDRHDLKCRLAAVNHRKARASSYTLDYVGKRGTQAFRINRNVHAITQMVNSS